MNDLTQSPATSDITTAPEDEQFAGAMLPDADDAREAVAPPTRPDGVPDKFWDDETSALRTEALLKSYLELEKRMGAGEEDAPIAELPNVPETPDAYEIETSNDLVASDPEINRRLHEAGFSQDQAKLVYKLAEEYLLPAVSDAYGEVFVQQEVGKLEKAFGGADEWRTMADQLRTWGQANLADDIYATLANSADGVMAMHAMMQAREPAVVHAETAGTPADEGSLRRMMQDPRYWRDRDPAFIAEVTRGFERVFKS